MVNKKFKTNYKEQKRESLYLVLPKLDELTRKMGANLHLAIDAVRAQWIGNLPSESTLSLKDRKITVTKEELIARCKAADVGLPQPNKKLSRIAARYGITADAWRNDEDFVFKYRFHLPVGGIHQPHLAPSYDLFFRLFGKRFYQGKEQEIKNTLENFDLSIRPLNLCSSIVNSEAIKNFLPDIDQKFTKDPFGVQREEHLILDKIKGKLIYLSTRKKEHGTYLAILNTVAYCTAGCAKCYRGEQTRELKKFTAISPDGSEEIVYFLPPVEQIKRLVKKWNQEKNPPEDILFSGGEPMDVSTEEWVAIIEELKKAKYLKFFRICTGDLFLGQPFRLINEQIFDEFRRFQHETGRPIKFACNLPHPKFITPEAAYVMLNFHKFGTGIEVQSQTPLEEEILCFQKTIQEKLKILDRKKISDEQMIEIWAPPLARSFKLLRELCIKLSMLTDRPYKFIHDMQQSVSVVYNMVLHSLLSEPHVGTTDAAVRPTSFAVFTPHLPNLNVGFHSLQYLANVKGAYTTDFKKVKMKFPHAVGAIAEYEEPYWEGINDKKTLEKITDISFWKKLRDRVKELVENYKYKN